MGILFVCTVFLPYLSIHLHFPIPSATNAFTHKSDCNSYIRENLANTATPRFLAGERRRRRRTERERERERESVCVCVCEHPTLFLKFFNASCTNVHVIYSFAQAHSHPTSPRSSTQSLTPETRLRKCKNTQKVFVYPRQARWWIRGQKVGRLNVGGNRTTCGYSPTVIRSRGRFVFVFVKARTVTVKAHLFFLLFVCWFGWLMLEYARTNLPGQLYTLQTLRSKSQISQTSCLTQSQCTDTGPDSQPERPCTTRLQGGSPVESQF